MDVRCGFVLIYICILMVLIHPVHLDGEDSPNGTKDDPSKGGDESKEEGSMGATPSTTLNPNPKEDSNDTSQENSSAELDRDKGGTSKDDTSDSDSEDQGNYTSTTEGYKSVSTDDHAILLSNLSSTAAPPPESFNSSSNGSTAGETGFSTTSLGIVGITYTADANYVNVTNHTTPSIIDGDVESTQAESKSTQGEDILVPTSAPATKTTQPTSTVKSSIKPTKSPVRTTAAPVSNISHRTDWGKSKELALGICVPIAVMIILVFGVYCYRKKTKSGRGYITLDDFGTFEGMQNPNYDGEL